jgi:hypothetical protein
MGIVSAGSKTYHDSHVQCLAFHAALELLLFRWGETGQLLVPCLRDCTCLETYFGIPPWFIIAVENVYCVSGVKRE